MSDDLCYFCGKDVGGMYTRYWDNKCHIECEPEYVAKKKKYDEITALRERLEQAERERDNYNAMYEQALITATRSRKYGFREGVEAARQAYGKIAQVYYGRTVRDMQGHFERDINSLSPTDTTSTVAEAAKVLLDKHDELLKQSKFRTANSFRKTEVLAFLRALAAQKGDE